MPQGLEIEMVLKALNILQTAKDWLSKPRYTAESCMLVPTGYPGVLQINFQVNSCILKYKS